MIEGFWKKVVDAWTSEVSDSDIRRRDSMARSAMMMSDSISDKFLDDSYDDDIDDW